MKFTNLIIVALLFFACKSPSKKLTSEEIVDKAIAAHCNNKCENSIIAFSFRNKHYKATKKGGEYQYERIFNDSIWTIRDVLTNDGFKRYVNDTHIELLDSIAKKYSNSVNSVHYFAQLPYGLNAPAAKKQLLGEASINGKEYYKIGVTFNEEGGGTDFDDKFVYWINKTDFSMDYLAYSYAVDGGGIRFREAYNKRIVNGITFLDYKNYKPETLNVALNDLDQLFKNDKLELVSKIEIENVKVELIK